MFPKLQDLPYDTIDDIDGFQTIGLIQRYCPSIALITLSDFISNGISNGDITHTNNNYIWLKNKIDTFLSSKKIVYIIPLDEQIMFPPNNNLSLILNQYTNDNVYLITEMDDIHFWQEEHHILCKILELPWIMLNDCIAFYYILNNYLLDYKAYYSKISSKRKNYLCMIGRVTTNIETHKIDIIKKLHTYGLSSYGEITILDNHTLTQLPPEIQNICKINEHPPYTEYVRNNCLTLEGSNTFCNNIPISFNTENFFHLLKEYKNIPLIVHPETTTGVFPSTEKSCWPVLLGKLFLIYGRPGTMKWIQRFYDIDISTFANISFDNIDGWNSHTSIPRLEKMIVDNYDLIKNADSIYDDMYPYLFDLNVNFVSNMYNFFKSQVELTCNS